MTESVDFTCGVDFTGAAGDFSRRLVRADQDAPILKPIPFSRPTTRLAKTFLGYLSWYPIKIPSKMPTATSSVGGLNLPGQLQVTLAKIHPLVRASSSPASIFALPTPASESWCC